MFNEEKVKKDLERMRRVYLKAIKDLNEIKARQDQIAKLIYEKKDNQS